MSTPITVPVSFPGADQSQQAMSALANAVARLGDRVGQLGSQQQQQARAQDSSNQAQTAGATQAIAFAQRIAGVANAVQSLTARLGSHGNTAGLIGSVASTTAQFAQMGAALGPEGAVVGGIAGFVVAITELSDAQSTAVEHTRALQEAQQQLAANVHETTESLAAEVVADETLFQQHMESASTFWDFLTHTRAEALQRFQQDRAMLQHDADQLRAQYEEADQGADGLAGLRRAYESGQGGSQLYRPTQADVTSTLVGWNHASGGTAHGSGPSAEERANAATASIRAQIDALEQEQNITSALSDQINALEQQFSATWAAAYDGASDYHEQLGTLTQAVDSLRSAEQTERDRQQALADEEAEQTRALHSLKMKTIQDEARALADSDQQRHKSIQQTLREEEQTKQKLQQEAQQRTQQGQEATSAIIGNLTNVFSIMAQGQMDAAHGAELLLAGFLQYISQRATIEALAQVAQGIGSYPDFGGMALHFAAAAAWGAVAVATGVGGAALASDAQSQAHAAQAQQQQPSEPHSSSGNDKGHASTYVINWNAPIYTGQDEAATGRVLRRMVDKATQRFPTA